MTKSVDWLTGLCTALVTPFTRRGEIDEDRLAELIERQIRHGVRVLIPCSTTGESATMTAEEDRRVMRVTVQTAQGRAKVVAGLGNNATSVVVGNARAARDIGVDAVKVVAPYYNKPMQGGLFAHFQTIAAALEGLPVILYNIPSRTSSNILPETVLRLAREVEGVVGIQESSRNFEQIMTVARDCPRDFKILAGDDDLLLPLAVLGISGAVSVTANIVPEKMLAFWQTIEKGDWEAARDQHHQLLPLTRAMMLEPNPLPVKAALALMNLLEEEYRLPLVPMEEDQKNLLRGVLQELDLV